MEKVAVYASFKKLNSKSVDFFLKQISDWCFMKNYDYTIYLDKVQNYSNLNNRTRLEDLKEDIEQQIYSRIIIKNISQLSKNAEDNVDFFNFALKNGCKLESIDGLDLILYKRIVERFNKNEEERER